MKYIAADVKIKIEELDGTGVREAVIRKLHINENAVKNFTVLRSSLDSRYHETAGIFRVFTVVFTYTEKMPYRRNIKIHKEKNSSPPCPTVSSVPAVAPIVVGAGPAGLFTALRLVQAGLRPVVIEKGYDMPKRIADVKEFDHGGTLTLNSNVQCGLGGAGTFSDGKLMSRIKTPYISYVLEQFHRFGAAAEIKYLAKPHIGTETIRVVVSAMKEYLQNEGVCFRFDTELTGVKAENNKICAVTVNSNETVPCSALFLGIGNAARDTFALLSAESIAMEAKPLAVGVRMEHEQKFIDGCIYGRYAGKHKLPPAEYALSFHDAETGRSVYTFCNCPGGYVINSSTEEDGICVNGMSYSRRNGKNANAALVVSVTPADYPSASPLAGVQFQRSIERAAYLCGGAAGTVPVMTIGDFIGSSASCDIAPTVLPKTEYADLSLCFPDYITHALRNALTHFTETMPGFDRGLLTACETRTSSPVRILRDRDTLESPSLKGLYPIGEGSGYAGGITSSAVDGVKAADAYMHTYLSGGLI